jgi:hypothetical protein
LRIDAQFSNRRHWTSTANFAPSQLKRHESAHKEPKLSVRKVSVLIEGNEAGDPDVAMAGVLNEEKVL